MKHSSSSLRIRALSLKMCRGTTTTQSIASALSHLSALIKCLKMELLKKHNERRCKTITYYSYWYYCLYELA